MYSVTKLGVCAASKTGGALTLYGSWRCRLALRSIQKPRRLRGSLLNDLALASFLDRSFSRAITGALYPAPPEAARVTDARVACVTFRYFVSKK